MKMKVLILVPLVSLLAITDQASLDTEYLMASGCPPRDATTSSRINTKITLIDQYLKWPEMLQFVIKRKDVINYIFMPSTNVKEPDDKRFRISGLTSKKFYIETIFTYDDSGVDFMYGWRENMLSPFFILCSILVNEDLTPVALLQRRAPPEIGFRDKKFYIEGEKILVSCTVQKLIRGTFTVVFPPLTNEVLEEDTFKFRSYSMILIKAIKGGNISCHVSTGISTWTTDFLRFIDKPYVEPEPNRTNIAITLAFFSCLTLLVLLIFGGYTLIVKQRKDNTKVMIEHHKEEAQNRINTRMSIHRASMIKPITLGEQQFSDDDD